MLQKGELIDVGLVGETEEGSVPHNAAWYDKEVLSSEGYKC